MENSDGLRIGEVAQLVGVSTRTIRHYHHSGVLLEPPRSSGGYRLYGLAEVAQLLRVRRFVQLGLSLAEVKDALADRSEGERDVREILGELRDELVREEASIAARREAVEELLARSGALSQSAAHYRALTRLREMWPAGHPGLDRETATGELLEATVGPGKATSLWQTYELIASDPAISAQLADLSERFERLATLPSSAPEIDDLVEHAARAGDAVRSLLPPEILSGDGDLAATTRLLDALTVDMSAAQKRCLHSVFARWEEQSR